MSNKLLQHRAEKRLFEAVTRYLEEPDCVEKSAKKLDEKLVKATLEDGRVVYIEDEDYDWNEVRHAADGRVLADDEEYDGEITPVITGKYSGKAAAHAAKNAMRAKRLETVNAANSEAFEEILPKIEKAIDAFAQKAIANDIITEIDDGYYAIDRYVNVNGHKVNTIFDFQDKIFKNIVAPYCKTLDRVDALACRRAWEKYIGFITENPKDKLKPFAVKLNKQINSIKRGATSTKKRNESAFAKTLFKAINEKLARKYAAKYDVSLNEANKMFIVKNIL